MLKYKSLAVAFSYPDDDFFRFFARLIPEREELRVEYDRLFRANEIWLYGTEYVAENEFQRAQALADISGFYRAFGLEPDNDRPDSLSCELEFMHYLICKGLRASKKIEDELRTICLDAQMKFFAEHLSPAAKRIAEKVTSYAGGGFYTETAQEMLSFLGAEEKFFEEYSLGNSKKGLKE